MQPTSCEKVLLSLFFVEVSNIILLIYIEKMADSDESVELLFFDTFSHDINEVNKFQSIGFYVLCDIQVKFSGSEKNAIEYLTILFGIIEHNLKCISFC